MSEEILKEMIIDIRHAASAIAEELQAFVDAAIEDNDNPAAFRKAQTALKNWEATINEHGIYWAQRMLLPGNAKGGSLRLEDE